MGINPETAARWTSEEAATRSVRLFPATLNGEADALACRTKEPNLLGDTEQLEICRGANWTSKISSDISCERWAIRSHNYGTKATLITRHNRLGVQTASLTMQARHDRHADKRREFASFEIKITGLPFVRVYQLFSSVIHTGCNSELHWYINGIGRRAKNYFRSTLFK